MLIELELAGRRWRADAHSFFDLAITLEFDGPQPRFFADDAASAEPLRSGDFFGSVRQGASCNCGVITLAPHCHGTHTECVGHITNADVHVCSVTPAPLSLAALVSAEPLRLETTTAATFAPAEASDLLLTADTLANAADPWADVPWSALVIRTLPNEPAKKSHAYSGPCPAPYFAVDAMRWVVQRDVRSLVVDLPSLDRADDGGTLAAHREYWGLPAGATDARQAARGEALVTELAYVPNDVPDGLYLLDLQVPAFASDAAPSRPILYPAQEIGS